MPTRPATTCSQFPTVSPASRVLCRNIRAEVSATWHATNAVSNAASTASAGPRQSPVMTCSTTVSRSGIASPSTSWCRASAGGSNVIGSGAAAPQDAQNLAPSGSSAPHS